MMDNLNGKQKDEPPNLSPEHANDLVESVLTVEEAVEKLGFGFFQVLLSVFCGLIYLADATEVMLLSVLGPIVKCQWNLSTTEEAIITSIVFLGFLFGGFTWGIVCDIIGRKRGLFIVVVMILFFGILSAIPVSADDSKIPGYPWLLICRFGVGFGAGGVAQAVTFYAEFLPKKARGVCIVILEVWWAIGSMFGALLAYAVMHPGGLGWHWFLGLAVFPLAVVLLLFPFVPESARHSVVKGHNLKAKKALKRVALYNCKQPLEGRIVTHEEKERLQEKAATAPITKNAIDRSHGSVSIEITKSEQKPLLRELEDTASTISPQDLSTVADKYSVPKLIKKFAAMFTVLFKKGMWKTTCLLFIIWFVCAWFYYGIVLLTTGILQYDPHCGINGVSNMTCEENELTPDDYIKIVWTSTAELPGLLVTVIIIEILGRKWTVSVEFLICMIGCLLLFICATQTVTYVFFFLIRAFAGGVFQAVYTYTPEVYPTRVRAFALGFHTSAARLGAISTPYVAQVLLHINEYATISVYSATALIAAIAAFLLPIETKGRSLTDEG